MKRVFSWLLSVACCLVGGCHVHLHLFEQKATEPQSHGATERMEGDELERDPRWDALRRSVHPGERQEDR